MKWIYTDDDFSYVGMDLAAFMVEAKIAKSKSEARRKIEGGSMRLNDQQVRDPFARLTADGNNFVLVQRMAYVPRTHDPVEPSSE